MKKILKVLLDIATIITIMLTILGGLYLALPEEVKLKIPITLNQIMILIFGNGSLGTFMVVTRVLLNKANNNNDLKIETLVMLVNKITAEIKSDRENTAIKDNNTNLMLKEVKELLALDLEIKKKNPVLPDDLKAKIEKLGK